MAEIAPEAAASMLENAFGSPPPAQPAPRTAPAPELPEPKEELAEGELPPVEEEPAEEPEPKAEETEEPEPELELDVDGEVVRLGKDKVADLVRKDRDYTRKTEEIARARDAIVAAARVTQDQAQFQQAAMGDIAELQALDQQLARFNQIDWAAAIDTDFVAVMKLQEQRTALREQRAAKLQELQAKQQQFADSQAQATQAMLAAEYSAVLTKLPQWRNSEVAQTERTAIVRELRAYGYQDAELAGLHDHRALLVARDAMKWRELQRTKGEKVKQVRDAPPVTRPGAAGSQQTNARTQFARDIKAYKQAGAKGQNRAQEAWLEKALSNTFK